MPKAPELTLNLDLSKLRVLIVGAGRVGLQKLKALPKSTRVTLIAPVFRRGEPAARPALSRHKRKARLSDVHSADLIFCATDDAKVNASLAAYARKKGKLVSVASEPSLGNFALPAVAKAGPIRISVSSSGLSPAVSKALRIWLEARLRGSKLLKLTAKLGKARARLKKHPEEKKRMLSQIQNPSSFARLLK
jgi:siroheme synthase-like protein